MSWDCEVCGGIRDGKDCSCMTRKPALPPVRSEPMLADALDAIRALMIELENYTMVHGADEDDEHALALGREVMRKANTQPHVQTGREAGGL